MRTGNPRNKQMQSVRKPACRLGNESRRKRDWMGLASIDVAQIASVLVGEGQVLAIGRDCCTRHRSFFGIRSEASLRRLSRWLRVNAGTPTNAYPDCK